MKVPLAGAAFLSIVVSGSVLSFARLLRANTDRFHMCEVRAVSMKAPVRHLGIDIASPKTATVELSFDGLVHNCLSLTIALETTSLTCSTVVPFW